MKIEEMLEDLECLVEADKCAHFEKLVNAGFIEEAKKFFVTCISKELQKEKEILSMEEYTVDWYKSRIEGMEQILKRA